MADSQPPRVPRAGSFTAPFFESPKLALAFGLLACAFGAWWLLASPMAPMFGVLIIGLGAFMLVQWRRAETRRDRILRDGIPAVGTITEVRTKFDAENQARYPVAYRYELGGRERTGYRVFDRAADAGRWHVGDRVGLRVDPADPDVSLMTDDRPRASEA